MKKRNQTHSIIAKAKVQHDDFFEIVKNNYAILDDSRRDCFSGKPFQERDLIITWDCLQGVDFNDLAKKYNLSISRIRDIFERQLRSAHRIYKMNSENPEPPRTNWTFDCRCGVELCLDDANPTLVRDKGWLILLSREDKIYYACPQCATKIQKAAELIAKYSDRLIDLTSIVKP